MIIYQLKYKGAVLAAKIIKGDSFMDRLCGLMFSKSLGEKDGLLFESKSLHTHFMRYNLDIMFLDRDCRILKIIRAMKPWRMSGIYWRAKYAIEMKEGLITSNVRVGEKVELICIS